MSCMFLNLCESFWGLIEDIVKINDVPPNSISCTEMTWSKECDCLSISPLHLLAHSPLGMVIIPSFDGYHIPSGGKHKGFSINGGSPIGWLVFVRENPIYKWMMTGGTPIYGKPHMLWYLTIDSISRWLVLHKPWICQVCQTLQVCDFSSKALTLGLLISDQREQNPWLVDD